MLHFFSFGNFLLFIKMLKQKKNIKKLYKLDIA